VAGLVDRRGLQIDFALGTSTLQEHHTTLVNGVDFLVEFFVF